MKSVIVFFAPPDIYQVERVSRWWHRVCMCIYVYTHSIYIGCTRKSELLFVKHFLGDNKTEFIEVLHAVTLGYYQHFT